MEEEGEGMEERREEKEVREEEEGKTVLFSRTSFTLLFRSNLFCLFSSVVLFGGHHCL